MKKAILITSISITTLFSFAQEKFNEDHIKIKPEEKFNEGYIVLKMYKNNLEQDTTTNITYFKNHKSRAERYPVTANGALEVPMIQISNKKTKELLTLSDHPLVGKKYQLDTIRYSDNEQLKFKVIIGDKKKKILGYICQQYLINYNGSVTFEVYATEEINSTMSNGPDFFKHKIKGMILYTKSFFVDSDGDTIESVAEVVEIVNKPLPDEMFSLIPPKDYTISDH